MIVGEYGYQSKFPLKTYSKYIKIEEQIMAPPTFFAYQ